MSHGEISNKERMASVLRKRKGREFKISELVSALGVTTHTATKLARRLVETEEDITIVECPPNRLDVGLRVVAARRES